ncbi:MAG TPA: AtpZ/AtpI family protein [Alphaproteobacteria bacterium]|nr:AtpZ/AtpI family protein [Alphaproteobacteria bacterium]
MAGTPKDLEEQIAKARARGTDSGPEGRKSAPEQEIDLALGFGLRIGAEFVSALMVGGGLGWLVGRWLGAMPIGILTGLLLGFVAAVFGVRRAMRVASEPAGITSQAPGGEPGTKMKETEEDDAEPS